MEFAAPVEELEPAAPPAAFVAAPLGADVDGAAPFAAGAEASFLDGVPAAVGVPMRGVPAVEDVILATTVRRMLSGLLFMRSKSSPCCWSHE